MVFPAISVQTTHNCMTAVRKLSVLPKVWVQTYYAAYFQICYFTFQNTSDNLNYITYILKTWIYILRDRLLNNVTKIYAELSVGVYRLLMQRYNNDVILHLQRD